VVDLKNSKKIKKWKKKISVVSLGKQTGEIVGLKPKRNSYERRMMAMSFLSVFMLLKSG
jgi:hypothetical protein